MTMSMNVRRVRDEFGTHIEPPLDQGWSDRAKLEWHCAVVREDTKLDVTITDAGLVIDGVRQVGYYGIQTRTAHSCTSNGVFTYGEAWTYLNGITCGAELERHRRHEEATR